MVISGLVLQCDPAQASATMAQLQGIPGISDLSVVEPPGRVVCVLEAPSPEASVRVLEHLTQIPGVYSVLPTYIHALEEDEEWNSPVVHS